MVGKALTFFFFFVDLISFFAAGMPRKLLSK